MSARLRWSSLAVVGLFCFLDPGRAAQGASIGVFFDAGGTRTVAEVAPYATFTCYVSLRDLGGQLSGYELSIVAPPTLTLLSATALPASSIDVGAGPTNWLVGVGACLDEVEPRVVLQLTAMVLGEGVNLELRIEASEPSSVGGAGPAYALCDDSLLEFELVTGAIVNHRPDTFGRVKTRYGEG